MRNARFRNNIAVKALALGTLAVLSFPAALSAQAAWIERFDPVRADPAMAFDSARGRAVVFVDGSTWEWDGGGWFQRRPTSSPPARSASSLVYDSARHCCVLFGGFDVNAGLLGDTWEWDGVEWTQRLPATSPSPRADHAMAYDSARNRAVLFGGGAVAETWEWDGADWSRRTSSPAPFTTFGATLAYDEARRRTVLFAGGRGAEETWEWDGSSWCQKNPTASPAGRVRGRMAFDPVRRRVLLFGGHDPFPFFVYAGTWEWDGVDWHQLSPATTPPWRGGHGMVHDTARGCILLHGGWSTNELRTDTWEWDGTDWVLLGTIARPEPSFVQLAYDEARGRVVATGGINGFGTWEWDGLAWSRARPRTAPSVRYWHVTVYDAACQRVLLFGGQSFSGGFVGDMWEWGGTDWSLVPSSGPAPSARGLHGMAYDAARRRIVLFGGGSASSPLADTWEYDGAQWTPLWPMSAPSARSGLAMVYLASRRRTVLFGGEDSGGPYDDTWEWDGTSWVERFPATRPAARARHAMSYDSARDVVVLHGGAGSGYLGDTWEWDGFDWVRQLVSPAPSPRLEAGMAFDSAHDQVVLIGGYSPTLAFRAATWIYTASPPAAARTYGSGCGALRGTPRISLRAAAAVGESDFGIDVVGGPGSVPLAAVLSLGSADLPLPGGCKVLVDPRSVFVDVVLASNANGFGTAKIGVPDDMNLIGIRLFVQAVSLDPGGPFLGLLSFTEGLRVRIGV